MSLRSSPPGTVACRSCGHQGGGGGGSGAEAAAAKEQQAAAARAQTGNCTGGPGPSEPASGLSGHPVFLSSSSFSPVWGAREESSAGCKKETAFHLRTSRFFISTAFTRSWWGREDEPGKGNCREACAAGVERALHPSEDRGKPEHARAHPGRLLRLSRHGSEGSLLQGRPEGFA